MKMYFVDDQVAPLEMHGFIGRSSKISYCGLMSTVNKKLCQNKPTVGETCVLFRVFSPVFLDLKCVINRKHFQRAKYTCYEHLLVPRLKSFHSELSS